MVKIPHYNTVAFTHFTYSIVYFFIVLFGYVGTTIYYSMVTVVCPVTKLHHIASLQSASSCNCTSYAGIVSLMYSNTPPPFFPYSVFPKHYITCVERSSSVVECRTRNRESPGSNPPLLPFRRFDIFRSLHRRPCSLSCINEYLDIDSGGNVSDLVLARIAAWLECFPAKPRTVSE